MKSVTAGSSATAGESDPVVIRMSGTTMRTIAAYLAAVVALVWVLLALQQIGIIHSQLSAGGRIAFATAWAAAYGACLAALRRRRVFLRRDRIDITGSLLPTRSIKLVDIVARRTNVGPGVPHQPILILKDGREAMLPGYLEHNDAFSEWLRTLPYRQRRT
jgi:hypothetical protein